MEPKVFEQTLKAGLDSLKKDLSSEIKETVSQEIEGKYKSAIDGAYDRIAKLERPDVQGNDAPTVDVMEPEQGRVRVYGPKDSVYKALGASVTRDEADKVRLGGMLAAFAYGPRTDAERQLLQAKAINSSSIEMPVAVASEFIDRMSPHMVAVEAGARRVVLQGKETHFIREANSPAVVWASELFDLAEAAPTFDSVALAPKTVRAFVEISREALQDSINLDSALSTVFTAAVAKAINEATFQGAGATEPQGLDVVVAQEQTYTLGGSPTWSTLIKARKQLRTANVDNFSLILAADMEEELDDAKDTTGQFILPPASFQNVRRFTNSGVTAGTGYLGDFSNVVYGFRLNPTVERFDQGSASRYSAYFLVVARLDIGVFRPTSFVRIEEAAA